MEPTQTITPARLGYRMPAEWEPHAATWLSWPHRDGISFPDAYQAVLPVLAKMVNALADSEPVHINVRHAEDEADARAQLRKHRARTEHIAFHYIPTNEPWCRDHGPMFLLRDEEPRLAVVDWDYNAWGWKYPPFDDDDEVPSHVAEALNLPVYKPGMVLEGGSVEVNGSRHAADDRLLPAQSESQPGPHKGGDRAAAQGIHRRDQCALAR